MASKQAHVSPYLQIGLIIITSIIITFTLYRRFAMFYTKDDILHVKPITPLSYEDFGHYSSRAQSGLFIKDYEKFDMRANEFIFNGTVWFMINPGAISIKTIDEFNFENGTILQKSTPKIKFIGDELFINYDIKVKFSSPLSLKDFPIDDHRIYLMLVNRFVLPSELMFTIKETDFKISANANIWGWQLVNKNAEIGYGEDKLDLEGDKNKILQYPKILFSLDYEQNNIRNTLTIILPLLLIFFISLFSFSINGTESWTLPLTALTINVSYRFVMENFSPKVGYFMTSDYLYNVFLSLSCIIFLLNVIDYYYIRTSKFTKSIIVIGLHASIVISTIYLLR